MTTRLNGSCLCGAVQFSTGDIHHLDVCHCTICQRWTGGPFIGADYRNGDVIVSKDDTLKWYASSEWAKRGFCSECGSSLFYRLNDVPEFWAVCAGALEMPSSISISKEIFIDKKPDYYSLAGKQERLTGPEFMASLQGTQHD